MSLKVFFSKFILNFLPKLIPEFLFCFSHNVFLTVFFFKDFFRNIPPKVYRICCSVPPDIILYCLLYCMVLLFSQIFGALFETSLEVAPRVLVEINPVFFICPRIT